MHIFAATVTLQANTKIAPSYGNGHFVRSSRRDRAVFDAGPVCCLKHSRIGQLFELNCFGCDYVFGFLFDAAPDLYERLHRA
jgi:hypothetical protein